MSNKPFFICDCGSDVLAVSHKWTRRHNLEEVGFVGDDGRYTFDPATVLDEEDGDHEWIAYCDGCGHGVTVEWLPEGQVRLLLADGE